MNDKDIILKFSERRRKNYERLYNAKMRRALNEQFATLAAAIEPDNYMVVLNPQNTLFLDRYVSAAPVAKVFESLYSTVGSDFARQEYNRLSSKSVKYSAEDSWRARMRDYAATEAGKRISSITRSSRKIALDIIREVLVESTNEGLGAIETAANIRRALVAESVPMNQWRALRIARTEVMTASNVGTYEGAKELEKTEGVTLEKFWIAAHDDRTRDTHIDAEQQSPIALDDKFLVGDYEMACPGDPAGGAEEVINCRCTMATEVKGFN